MTKDRESGELNLELVGDPRPQVRVVSVHLNMDSKPKEFDLDLAYVKTGGQDLELFGKPIWNWNTSQVLPILVDEMKSHYNTTGRIPILGVTCFDDNRYGILEDIASETLERQSKTGNASFRIDIRKGMIEIGSIEKGGFRGYIAPAQKIPTAQGPLIVFGNERRIMDGPSKRLNDVASEAHDQGALVFTDGDLLSKGLRRLGGSIIYRMANGVSKSSPEIEIIRREIEMIDAFGLNNSFPNYQDGIVELAERYHKPLVAFSSARSPRGILKSYTTFRNIDTSGLREMTDSMKGGLHISREFYEGSRIDQLSNIFSMIPVLVVAAGLKLGAVKRTTYIPNYGSN